MVVNVLAFGGGFVIMALELLGGRILAPYFGNSIYVWGSIISVFMLSLALGYLIGGYVSLLRPSLARFAALFLLGAIVTGPLVFYADPLLKAVFDHIEDPRYGSLVAASALFVAPTAVLGMISPYSVRLMVGETAQSGRVAGTLYFVSTLGSALGTLATSFYFVLWFEIDTIVLLLTGALLALAAIGALANRAA
ncbi:MAG TPA: fused MFS/spermidine synthase [Pseudomonadales bacterium]|nr:fused MFS/spermidine synthase [Pseudomonadales bacterium]